MCVYIYIYIYIQYKYGMIAPCQTLQKLYYLGNISKLASFQTATCSFSQLYCILLQFLAWYDHTLFMLYILSFYDFLRILLLLEIWIVINKLNQYNGIQYTNLILFLGVQTFIVNSSFTECQLRKMPMLLSFI